jgi:hypothetical protein
MHDTLSENQDVVDTQPRMSTESEGTSAAGSSTRGETATQPLLELRGIPTAPVRLLPPTATTCV